MTCTNCNSTENKFPTCPEAFTDYPGWCHVCIHDDLMIRYDILQSRGAFVNLKYLMIDLEGGKIDKNEFEQHKKKLFEL